MKNPYMNVQLENKLLKYFQMENDNFQLHENCFAEIIQIEKCNLQLT